MSPLPPLAPGVALAIAGASRPDPASLRLCYQVTNGTEVPVWVRVRPCYGSVVTTRPYSSLTLNGSGVNLLIGDSPLPSFLSVYSPILALSVLLQPGAVHDDEVEVELPLVEQTAYLRSTGAEESRSVFVHVLNLMTMWHPAPLPLQAGETGLQCVYASPTHLTAAQVTLAEAIEVRMRLDRFERFELPVS